MLLQDLSHEMCRTLRGQVWRRFETRLRSPVPADHFFDISHPVQPTAQGHTAAK
jgi:hypothetical protein